MGQTLGMSAMRAGCMGLALAFLPASGMAMDLAAPQGEVLLTVSGAISSTNAEGTAQFDLGMLQGMAVTEFTTTTIWTDGEDSYTGVVLKTLLESLGAEGTTLKASAINDYTIEIPVDSLTDAYPIVAYFQNGAEMPVRNKGPLWVIYPYASDTDLQSEVIYSRSIWQLDRLEVTN
ncbi:molybdopterin-dependent oxidoreductase [Pseudoruegeria sp. SHC-113]|uniref:molybdopterin-dependent oxidoreductase n=1 Tax=Pseudoruegeria sp. SHC-113 TaxID=2855439 RepID=UPI0021BB6F6C|nr:molybdopterin-dependent oxidoreductase [Pseudoruegeria sp. SHC-113]